MLGSVLLVVIVCTIDLIVWGMDRELATGGLLPLWVVPAASVVMCSLLLVRHTYPLFVWTVQWVFSLCNLLLPDYYPFAGLLVALHAVATRCNPRTAGLVLATAVVPFGLFSYRSAQDFDGGSAGEFLQAATVWIVIVGVVWGLGRFSYASERRARDAQARLARQAELAVEAERLRLARELHDSVTGAVTAMIMHAAGARANMPTGEGQVHDSLRIVEQAGVQAMNELHRLLGLLRAPAGGEPAGSPAASLAQLDKLIDAFRHGGLDVSVKVVGNRGSLDPSVDLAAYRIVQECLTNVVKHAGPDAVAVVSLDWRQNFLHLDVHNTPPAGPSPTQIPSSGLGLLGLRERVHLIGGTLSAGAVQDGWLVQAELPLTARSPVLAATEELAVTENGKDYL